MTRSRRAARSRRLNNVRITLDIKLKSLSHRKPSLVTPPEEPVKPGSEEAGPRNQRDQIDAVNYFETG
jgi:hypothetical protein